MDNIWGRPSSFLDKNLLLTTHEWMIWFVGRKKDGKKKIVEKLGTVTFTRSFYLMVIGPRPECPELWPWLRTPIPYFFIFRKRKALANRSFVDFTIWVGKKVVEKRCVCVWKTSLEDVVIILSISGGVMIPTDKTSPMLSVEKLILSQSLDFSSLLVFFFLKYFLFKNILK
jgi:hypothetical protein